MANVEQTGHIQIELSTAEAKYLKSLVGFVGLHSEFPHSKFVTDLYYLLDDVIPGGLENKAWRLGEYAVQPNEVDWNDWITWDQLDD